MRSFHFYLLLIFVPSILVANTGEFVIHSNGLMYSDTTMHQLTFIVDTLNLKFKQCELVRPYYSKQQAKAYYLSLSDGDLKQAKADMEANISFEDFIKKHPKSEVDSNLTVVKHQYKNYQEKEIVEFSSLFKDHEIDKTTEIQPYTSPLKGKWIFEYQPKTSYNSKSLYGFFFTTEFESKPIPETYARLIQYVDCMVDTSQTIFKENATSHRIFDNKEHSPKVYRFLAYIDSIVSKPLTILQASDKKMDYRERLIFKINIIDSIVAQNDTIFTRYLSEAVVEAINCGVSSEQFESYVGRYYSKAAELELKRGRKVIGGCSMDSSPRYHALDIALLSAETTNWTIFLRAHLDIMNDKFDRVSDGSYAWGERGTYIKELEELGINVVDLLLGTCFRIENPSKNHYYGSIGRIGRALSESKDLSLVEDQIFTIIKDPTIDYYNRVIFYFLALHLGNNLKSEFQSDYQCRLNAVIKEIGLPEPTDEE